MPEQMKMMTKEDFTRAIDLYRDWNEKVNVVSRKDIGFLYEHHILHSLAIKEYLDRFFPEEFAPGQSVLDVGTGGGFPGIPLAMACPGVHFTLCDSIGKKVRVARAVADGLGLTNVTCVNARAESLPDSYDWIVSRAVTSLDNFYPWIKGKYRRGVLVLKGGDVNEEISGFLRSTRRKADSVRVWSIKEWLEDDYFAEKFVIHI